MKEAGAEESLAPPECEREKKSIIATLGVTHPAKLRKIIIMTHMMGPLRQVSKSEKQRLFQTHTLERAHGVRLFVTVRFGCAARRGPYKLPAFQVLSFVCVCVYSVFVCVC